MAKILITGATGNVGIEVLAALSKIMHTFQVYAGVRNVQSDSLKLSAYSANCIYFDFENTGSYQQALQEMDLLFLLRPPQIADVATYFTPLIEHCKKEGIKHIIFLSVQGVEKNSLIPHHKIEKLIVDSGIPYTFLRPAYFMQNFTTTLYKDIIEKNLIFLPAGKAKFTLIDVRDVGNTAAHIMMDLQSNQNVAYALTSNEALSFGEMSDILSKRTGGNIHFESPGLLRFFYTKRKEQMPVMQILVMIMLHYLPRFQKQPPITNGVQKITGKLPVSFEQFVEENRDRLLPITCTCSQPYSQS